MRGYTFKAGWFVRQSRALTSFSRRTSALPLPLLLPLGAGSCWEGQQGQQNIRRTDALPDVGSRSRRIDGRTRPPVSDGIG